jgi:NADH:ubiquinone oxidoreductase subunit C
MFEVINFTTPISNTYNLISYSISKLSPKFLHSMKIIVARQDLRPIAAILKLHSLTRFMNAIDAMIVDNINFDLRFGLNYQLLSTTTNSRCVITTRVSESVSLLSLQSLYPAFN